MAQSSATALSHRLRGQSAKALERPRATEAKGTGTEAADPRGVGGFDSDGLAAPAETTRTVSEVGIGDRQTAGRQRAAGPDRTMKRYGYEKQLAAWTATTVREVGINKTE